MKLVSYISKWGVIRSLAISISSFIINGILNIMGSSIGAVAVYFLKYFFVSYTKYAKKYVWWGPKVPVEYINFEREGN